MAKARYSTTNVYDIIPECKDGADAFAALEEDEADAKKTYNGAVKLFETLTEKADAIGFPGAFIFEAISEGIEDIGEDCKEAVDNTRKWAQESYDKMYNHVPIMTGHLRDSIRFMGHNAGDINVWVDRKVVAKRERRPNIVPYYTGSAPGSRKLMVGHELEPEFANADARPKEWWKGGTTPLKHYLDRYWRYNIKLMLAEKYDIDYDPKLDDPLYGDKEV